MPRRLSELGGLGPDRLLVDVGAGTGEIGLEILQRTVRYVGLDDSRGMLDVFAARARERGLSPSLIVADARDRWPVADGSARVIFGSRSLHWLAPRELVDEALRVAAKDGAVLLVGRGVHDPRGPRERIRVAMREFLSAAGFEGRSGGRECRRPPRRMRARRGASPIPVRTVARWPVRRPPRASLDDWRSKPGLAGIDVPAAIKDLVLERVAEFASDTFGDIDAPIESEECYTLVGATLTERARTPELR